MGGVVGGIFGGSSSGSGAAAVESEFFDRAIKEMRRQFNLTRSDVEPFVEAGRGALPGLIDSSTVEGLDRNLGAIFDTDIFGELVDERTRALQNQLGASGLQRSGTALTEIANVPTGIGLNLEQLLNARQSGLAGSGQNAALGLGSIGAQTSAGIADLLASQGQSLGAGILTDAQAGAQGRKNLFNAATTAASIFFGSDPRLKENAEVIGEVDGIKIWQWDWIEGAKDTVIADHPNIGFMADEVEEKYPDYVGSYGGFKVIYYPALLDHLEAKNSAIDVEYREV